MKRIAGALAALDPLPDIVCLQEVETASIRSNVAHPRTRAGQTQLQRLMEMLEEALASLGKRDVYEAFYFPAHAYQLGPKTQIYTTGLAILAHRDFEVNHHNSHVPADITYQHLLAQPGYRDPFAQLYRMTEAELRKWPTAGFMRLRMHLDHIFTGPALKWIDFDQTHAFGDRTCAFHGLSDHTPLIGRCRISLPKQESHPPRPLSRPPH